MVLHHESREFAVEDLVVGRGGTKLKETKETEPANEGPPKVEKGRLDGPGLIMMMRSGPNGITGELMAIAQGMGAPGDSPECAG
jgi:uncharacterized protein (TIGR03435 family)